MIIWYTVIKGLSPEILIDVKNAHYETVNRQVNLYHEWCLHILTCWVACKTNVRGREGLGTPKGPRPQADEVGLRVTESGNSTVPGKGMEETHSRTWPNQQDLHIHSKLLPLVYRTVPFFLVSLPIYSVDCRVYTVSLWWEPEPQPKNKILGTGSGTMLKTRTSTTAAQRCIWVGVYWVFDFSTVALEAVQIGLNIPMYCVWILLSLQ